MAELDLNPGLSEAGSGPYLQAAPTQPRRHLGRAHKEQNSSDPLIIIFQAGNTLRFSFCLHWATQNI